VYLLPEYRLQLDVSLPPEDDPKFLACCLLSENLPHFDVGEFPHHPLATITPKILNGPTSINPVYLNQMSVEARQLGHFLLSTHQETFDSVTSGHETEMCGSAIMHEVQFSANDSWHVGQEIRHAVFQESFLVPPCKPTWKYLGSE
jgi:hypothetical protein